MHEGKIRNRMANSSKKKKVNLGVPQGSVLGLEPKLELFEVWEINVRQIIIIANGINSKTPKLQTALARVLDKLERN